MGASLFTVRMLQRDIAEGIRVLATRDGLPLTEEQIQDRARNIVAGLIGNYEIRSLDEGAAVATGSRLADDVARVIEVLP